MLDLLPDLFDDNLNELDFVPVPFASFGGKSLFWGQVVTVKCYEDNSRVKELLNQSGSGKVLVIDGGGSIQRALLGDLIADSAVRNGWAGVVIYGGVRDVGAIATMPIGVKALAALPIKTQRKGIGEVDVILNIADVAIEPGMWLYADLNGVAVSRSQLEIPRGNE